MSTPHAPFDRLATTIDGSVHDDLAHRRLVAQDASPYRVMPSALVEPCHEHDCERIVAFAAEHGMPVIARGGGTGLAGQCVGSGIVVDVSRHMNRVLEIDPVMATARVEPGVTASQLNAAAASAGLVFGPDPSTSNRATLGGMLANNAWGPHAPVDGTTRDQLVALRAVLADGNTHALGTGGANHEDDRARQRELAGLLARHADALRRALPKPHAALCSNTGYPLHCLLDEPLDGSEGPGEALLFAGAEGTLGLVTEITLRLRPLRRDRRLLCPHFDDLRIALRAVRTALDAGACAVELLDHRILELTRDHPGQLDNRFWVQGDPSAVLLIEFADGVDSGDLPQRLAAEGAGAIPGITGADVERAWALRRAGLGLLMGYRAARKPVSGLEDTAVPVDRLPGYIEAVTTLMADEGVECVHYGSVSMGLVHLRPLLDLSTADDRARYRHLLDGLAALVSAHGGIWATKHGVGRLRAPWLARVLGEETVAAMAAVKSLYDPDNRFNPGKILDPPDPLSDLRAAAPARTALPATGLDWSDDLGLAAAAGRCQGAGACRKAVTEGGMCPSYQATREEMHSTRGRANLFQQAIAAPDPATELAADELHEALSLCLSCKACQHECPASVDMARLKAEQQYQRGRNRGFPLAARAIGAFATLSAIGARMPRLANGLGRRRWFQRLAGIDGPPPALAPEPLSKWLATRAPDSDGPRGSVILALDPHTMYYEPEVGRTAIAVIERLGFSVRTTPCVSAGRPAISQGRLDRAREDLRRWLRAVEAAGPSDLPVIGLEPSELLTLRDEAPQLVGAAWEARARAAGRRAVLFEEWLAEQGEALQEACSGGVSPPSRVAVHVHCHAKAARATDAALRVLAMLPSAEVSLLPAGCCGMAGAFGYRRATAAVSRQVAELALAPAIRNLPPETTVAAHGTSCRQQIARLTDRRARHPAEIVARAIGVTQETP
ncbi:MAG: FAD-linked oxidase C-terminal domain-containing protein [Halofilum sp. (in: g-proteobacteria)]|nr:FAD-linked oxidase C-terminal domain-containing protein [Halofilum sp. (in: g-proteobacteria)]